MQSKAKTVGEYLAEIPPDRRAALVTLRKLIRKAAPTAKETMQCGMAVFLAGDTGCALASQKHYMALYCDVEVLAKYRSQLAGLDCGKCCIRFRHVEDLPLKVISAILKESFKVRKSL